MDKFTDIIRQDNIDEGYSKSRGYTNFQKTLNHAELVLHPGSNLAKGIAKELGKGYLDDFAKMKEHFDEIMSIWQDIEMDVEMSNK